ncbi:hypothetical protein [Microbacterium aurum]
MTVKAPVAASNAIDACPDAASTTMGTAIASPACSASGQRRPRAGPKVVRLRATCAASARTRARIVGDDDERQIRMPHRIRHREHITPLPVVGQDSARVLSVRRGPGEDVRQRGDIPRGLPGHARPERTDPGGHLHRVSLLDDLPR